MDRECIRDAIARMGRNGVLFRIVSFERLGLHSLFITTWTSGLAEDAADNAGFDVFERSGSDSFGTGASIANVAILLLRTHKD